MSDAADLAIVNFAEIATEDWRFVERFYTGPTARWTFYRNAPKNALERLVRKPSLARYRAAYEAAGDARRASRALVVSHLPRATRALATAMRMRRATAPHVAFSFNFTDLPTGADRAAFASAFARVERFVVYSTFERDLYADYFDIDIDRIDRLDWAMETPPVADDAAMASLDLPARPFIAAGGGEGRDYATLIEAMRRLPDINLVLMCRPHNLARLAPPDNVRVHANLPAPLFWRVISDSRLSALPLRDDRTACGHITMIGAFRLGAPVVATASRGVADYVGNGRAIVTPPGDPAALAAAIRAAFEDEAGLRAIAARARAFAETHCDPVRWARHIEEACRLLA